MEAPRYAVGDGALDLRHATHDEPCSVLEVCPQSEGEWIYVVLVEGDTAIRGESELAPLNA